MGLGMRMPARQESLSGNEKMTYLWKFFNFGSTFNSQGKAQIGFNTTNRIGLKVNFRLAPFLDIYAQGQRSNLMNAYRQSLNYEFNGILVDGFYDNFSFLDYGIGAKVKTYNLYFSCAVNFQPNIFSNNERKVRKQDPSETTGNYLNDFGTGLVFSNTVQKVQRSSFYLGIGQEVDFMDSPANLELGFSFSLTPLYDEQIDFYRDGNRFATNVLHQTTNAVFVTLSQPLQFRKRDKSPVYSPEIIEIQDYKVGHEKVRVGESLVLENIIFLQSSSELTSSSLAQLDDVYQLLLHYPEIRIQISGHTSTEGSRRENLRLSEERAESCKGYLIKKGISAKRIRTVGYGPDKPISEDEPEKNRRVEMLILGIE
mgnify:CR=1 FL=1